MTRTPDNWRQVTAWVGVALVIVSLPWWATLAMGAGLLVFAGFAP